MQAGPKGQCKGPCLSGGSCTEIDVGQGVGYSDDLSLTVLTKFCTKNGPKKFIQKFFQKLAENLKKHLILNKYFYRFSKLPYFLKVW